MNSRKHARIGRIIGELVGFVVIFAGVFFGVQFITKTGFFKIPGVVYYDESLSAAELETLRGIFTEEVELDKDVTISATESLEYPDTSQGDMFITEIYVPVTDFYSAATNVDATDVAELMNGTGYDMISVAELDFSRKLLAVNNNYYLDKFTSGAVYRAIHFESEKYQEEIEPLVRDKFAKAFPSEANVMTLAQTGVTALSRGMNVKLSQVGDAKYFAEKIGPFLKKFDLTHTSNESSFSAYAGSRNICSDARFIDTLTAIGLDIVELTGNHNQDCGDTAALETIDLYEKEEIKTVGGGRTATEAAIPLKIDEKGSKVTMLAFNQSTGGATYDNTPGANQYYEETAKRQIAEAKARGGLVIVDVQYYECAEYAYEYEVATCDYAGSSAGDQVGFFRHLIDLGADVVVGTSAHQPQTFELYGDGVIYYGLGNLFFDQIWWPGTTRSLILVHHIYNDKLLQTEIVPTVYDADMQTRLMDEETTAWFIERLASKRP